MSVDELFSILLHINGRYVRQSEGFLHIGGNLPAQLQSNWGHNATYWLLKSFSGIKSNRRL